MIQCIKCIKGNCFLKNSNKKWHFYKVKERLWTMTYFPLSDADKNIEWFKSKITVERVLILMFWWRQKRLLDKPIENRNLLELLLQLKIRVIWYINFFWMSVNHALQFVFAIKRYLIILQFFCNIYFRFELGRLGNWLSNISVTWGIYCNQLQYLILLIQCKYYINKDFQLNSPSKGSLCTTKQ